jgi:hypothetical protein
MSASTVIPDRFTFAIAISGVKAVQFEMALARNAIAFWQKAFLPRKNFR